MPRSNCQPADTSIAQLKRVGERLKSIIASAPPHRKAQVIAYARTLFVRLEREALGRLPQHGCGGQCVRSATVGVLNSLEDAPRQRRNVRLAQGSPGCVKEFDLDDHSSTYQVDSSTSNAREKAEANTKTKADSFICQRRKKR